MFVIYEYDKYDGEDWDFIGYCEKEEDAIKICAEAKSEENRSLFYGEIDKSQVPNIEVVYKYTITYHKIWDNIKQKENWVMFYLNYRFWKYNGANISNNVLRKQGDKTIEAIVFLKEFNEKKAQEVSKEMLDKYLEGELK